MKIKAKTNARVLYTPFGVVVVYATFPWTEHEAKHWVRYPSDRPEGAYVYDGQTEESAHELAAVLNR